MKRKILLFTIMTALACLLTITVGAVSGSDSNEFGNPTIIEGINEDTTLMDKDSRVVLKNEDGTYSTYPTYYICDKTLNWQGTTQYKFDTLNTRLGTNYNMMSIVRIEVVKDARVWNGNGGSIEESTNLIEVHFREGSQITEIGGQVFRKCVNLTTINIPATITSLGWLCFEHCYSLSNITFEEGGTELTLGGPSFQRCDSLKTIVLPNRIKGFSTIEFQQCMELKEVRFGSSFTTIGADTFAESNNMGLRLYLPTSADLVNINKYVSNATIIITGTEADARATGISKIYSYEEFISAGSPQGGSIVYGCPGCLITAGDHALENINGCVGKCSYCGVVELLDTPNHDFSLSCVYENGFGCDGTIIKSCKNEGCGYVSENETIGKIIEFAGYSIKEDGEALCVGYFINYASLRAYRQANENVNFKHGIVFAVAQNDNSNVLTHENGVIKATNYGTVVVEFDESKFGYDFMVRGFDSTMKSTKLIMCAYTYDGEKIGYVSNAGNTPSPITYSEIRG